MYYKDKISKKTVGYLALLDGKLLQDLIKDEFQQINIKKLIRKEIFGDNLLPNTEASGQYHPTTGIGYRLSTKGGDHNNDGINDLVILTHYSFGLAGSLHIISVSDLS